VKKLLKALVKEGHKYLLKKTLFSDEVFDHSTFTDHDKNSQYASQIGQAQR